MRSACTLALFAAVTLATASTAAAETIVSFNSPSKNIGCTVGSSFGARCDIRHKDWSRGPRPKGCPTIVDWGQGLIVGKSGKGHIVCAGDTAFDPNGATLAYGKSRTVGRFKCTSRTSGMTCKNTRNGHGFFLSKQKYRLF